MDLILKILFYLYLCSGVRCVLQIPWLPCQFTDEQVSVNKEGHTETQHMPREAMLQFGQKGEAPVNPHAITFLITGSKLDLRRYMEGVEADQLECELRRYSTEGIHVRWPVIGAQDYNFWFTCTLRHSKGLFTVTGFLRQPTDQPPPGQQDYHRWSAIGDREILTTSVALVIKTKTPSVKAGLWSQQKLHCQFGIDHKAAHATVEWHWQYHGKRTKLFSHNSRTGETQGTGVDLKALIGGDASYKLLSTEMSSEGTYVCSVSVTPLSASVDINLHIEEPPHVSLSVGPVLSLQEGTNHKVICRAERYYPLDVEIVWSKQDVAALVQELQNVQHSNHEHSPDNTLSVSAHFFLQASLKDSGKLYTCSVSHQSLSAPIRTSFILSVEEPSNWMMYLTMVAPFIVLYLLVRRFHLVKRHTI
ncbi:LOW QUALITY PROTEIN: tapasin-related protein-like [Parambassis ranga]|uniref:LOW QUALITY PROTEIN: tapasin-related protein-like n=1 Tax=Parambassis ranga TaxID=210632 RepID=A0A6P7JL44_9TELE|nr:LOW QUALITY PROTEIN: tapasin-related protein-like [Parambassis ranga]